MTKESPIGVFDSGLGGLTIVKALGTVLPEEAVVYLGDTAHLPYGDKAPERVEQYSTSITEFLKLQEVKAIIIACNTASAVAYDAVLKAASFTPVFEVIGPAVSEAVKRTSSGNIGVIGTRTTIQSLVYRKRLLEALPDASVTDKATPLLVPMIEEGWLHNQVSQDVIDAYMSDTGFSDIDTLILGCTHYPLIKNQISSYFQENYDHQIELVDSATAVADSVSAFLKKQDLLSPEKTREDQFYLTDYSPHFRETAALFLEKEVNFEAVNFEGK